MTKPTTKTAALAAGFGAMLALSGCLGAGARSVEEIRAESQRRGGGAEPFLVREAEAAVAAQVAAGRGSLVIASIDFQPGYVALVAADPRTPGNWDRYRYSGGRQLAESTPTSVGHGASGGFLLGDFHALERLPALVADARERLGPSAEARLSSVSIRPVRRTRGDGGPATRLELQVAFNDPRRGTLLQHYDADGRPL